MLWDESTDDLILGSASKIGIGTTAPEYALHIGGDSGADAMIQSSNNTDTTSARLFFRKSGGTMASPTIVADNELIGSILGYAYDGNSWGSMASMVFDMDGTPGDGDLPGRIEFYTAADGSESLSERMRITSAGHVGIGTTPSDRLHIMNNTSGATTFLTVLS